MFIHKFSVQILSVRCCVYEVLPFCYVPLEEVSFFNCCLFISSVHVFIFLSSLYKGPALMQFL